MLERLGGAVLLLASAGVVGLSCSTEPAPSNQSESVARVEQAQGPCSSPADPCDDGNLCTIDTCNVDAGTCQHVPPTGACAVAADCNDGIDCTVDPCTACACVHTPDVGCCMDAADCDDSNRCTSDICIAATHTCSYANNPAACNDSNDCTIDTCVADKCTNTPKPSCCDGDEDCQDQSACTTNT